MATTATRRRGRSAARRPSPRWVARYGFLLVSVVDIAAAVFLIWQGVSGTPLFIGNGSGWSTDINTTADSLRHAGVTPYSADQQLLTASGIMLAVGILPLYLGRTLRGQVRYFSIGCGILALFLLAIVCVLCSWAGSGSGSGHAYSNYLPPEYPEFFAIPIAVAIVATLVFGALTVFFARWARKALPAAPPVRPWW